MTSLLECDFSDLSSLSENKQKNKVPLSSDVMKSSARSSQEFNRLQKAQILTGLNLKRGRKKKYKRMAME